ncbi:MAG: hypothetical protein HC933_19525 [Pleurocapsa sp. SU_196_0]|nr:hypothetical protein [Pleurocapsa sp. SU_196_0]
MTGQARRDTALMLTACAALLGGLVALYLSLHSFGISSLVCPVAGCDRVQSSAYAKLWGVPIALFGLGFFASLSFWRSPVCGGIVCAVRRSPVRWCSSPASAWWRTCHCCTLRCG